MPKKPISSGKTTGPSKKRGRTAVRITEPSTEVVQEIERQAETATMNKASSADRVRSEILEAALEYFGAFGFDGATTRAIAERVGITHTLVLYHFKSKERLWIATVENVLKQYDQEFKKHLDNAHATNAKTALKTFISDFVHVSAKHPQLHRILTSEGNQDTDRLRYIIDNFLRDHFNMITDLIRRGQRERSVRDADPARLYYLIIGMGGTPFTLASEYKTLTGRNVQSEAETLRFIAFIYDMVFTP